MKLPFVWKLREWTESLSEGWNWLRRRWECLKWGHELNDSSSCSRCGGYHGWSV